MANKTLINELLLVHTEQKDSGLRLRRSARDWPTQQQNIPSSARASTAENASSVRTHEIQIRRSDACSFPNKLALLIPRRKHKFHFFAQIFHKD